MCGGRLICHPECQVTAIGYICVCVWGGGGGGGRGRKVSSCTALLYCAILTCVLQEWSSHVYVSVVK